MTRYRSTAFLLFLIFSALTGCSSVLQTSRLPEGFAIRDITKADASAPFAVANGVYATVSDGKLNLVDAKGTAKEIAAGAATALSFSPDGGKLAAALPNGNKTILRLFDREGKVSGETTIPGKVTAVSWRSGKDILATTLDIRRYSFGSSLASTLYVWDGSAAPTAKSLASVTVRPGVAKLPDQNLYDSLNLAVSPYGDEIAYSILKDPPLFNPYLSITTRHIESGAEREIGVTSVGSGGPVYTPDGENLIVGDYQSVTRKLSIPDGKEINAWPTPGYYPAISPSGSYLFLDGRLYLDGNEVASFPQQSKAAFLPDGSGLAISYKGKVYLVTGLNDKPAPPLPSDLERLLQLRKLRSLGLITEKEFRAQKGKAPAQKEKDNTP